MSMLKSLMAVVLASSILHALEFDHSLIPHEEIHKEAQDLAASQQEQLSTLSRDDFREILGVVHSTCTSVSEPTAGTTPTAATRVLMSLSVPVSTWLDLNEQLNSHESAFVLRGLPDNSFKQLADKIYHLMAWGVTVPIQIDPRPFTTYKVEQVPAFIIERGEDTYKVTGAVSSLWCQEAVNRARRDT